VFCWHAVVVWLFCNTCKHSFSQFFSSIGDVCHHHLIAVLNLEQKTCANCFIEPLASAPGTATHAASKYCDTKLRPILDQYNTICKSSDDIVAALESLKHTNITSDDYLLVADVTALYPSIPLQEALIAVKQFCRETSTLPRDELEFVLEIRMGFNE
jgi:hypothetical protein